MPTIEECTQRFIRIIKKARSKNTADTYGYGLQKFSTTLRDNDIDPKTSSVDKLTEDHVALFIDDLGNVSERTEALYLVAVNSFYKFLGSEDLRQFNYPRIESIIQYRHRKPDMGLPTFPEDDIDELLGKLNELIEQTFENDRDKLAAYRDRAFLFTLADTGFRVSEACALKINNIDNRRRRAIIKGKGNKEAVVRFSRRSINAINDYLAIRSFVEDESGRQRGSLPVFSRHDKGANKKRITAIDPATARLYITGKRITELLGREPSEKITPHSFRHYFVTRVVRKKGLEYAQIVARHENMQTTKRYTHLNDDEVDKAYREIFDA